MIEYIHIIRNSKRRRQWSG